MASTAAKLDIYNMALGFVGARTVASPRENTPEAVQCELYWDRARRAALQEARPGNCGMTGGKASS